jgi:N-acetylneuraminate synthase
MGIFTIAEIGINHNGDIEIAKKLITEAKNAGFSSVKFQKRNIDKVYTQDFLNSERESPWGNTQRAQKKGLEFEVDEYNEIDKFCKSIDIKWFASAWDLDSQDFLNSYDLEYNKIASPMIIYDDLLTKVAKNQKHTFISTGMSTIENIDNAVNIFKANECSFELMHCVSTYPLSPEDANLNKINTLRDKYNCNVGYSGHETGLAISYGALGLGISSLERHITLNRAMYGSDQAASLEPSGFKMLIGVINTIEASMGDGVISVNKKEVEIANKLRAHI